MVVSSKPQPDAPEPRKIRVAIVDDSIVVRGLFSRWLSEEPDIEIVGIHRNGLEALRNIGIAKPDVTLLDIEMPEMDGLTALPLLLQKSPETRVLVVSSLSQRGADVTLKCLMRGATDYLTKPSSMGNGESPTAFRASLLTRIRALGARGVTSTAAAPPLAGMSEAAAEEKSGQPSAWARRKLAPEAAASVLSAVHARPEVLILGASTGGPQAITALLDSLGPVLDDIPVIIAQHMPSIFTQMFAAHLKRQLCVDAFEIDGGETLKPGCIYVCRGGQNTEIHRSGEGLTAIVHTGGGDTKTQPSIDMLFSSVARAVGPGVIAIALTGLGSDAAAGASAVARARGVVMAQDEASSIVWGIPGAVSRTGTCALIEDIQGLAEGVRLIFERT